MQIQWKPGGNNTEIADLNTEIAGLDRCSPQNLLHMSRASPIGKYLWVNTSDLFDILDMGGWGLGEGAGEGYYKFYNEKEQ